MSDSKHTQGPWAVSQQKGLTLFIVGEDEAIAEVPHANFNKETFANADLIAAAPELLAACERILELGKDANCGLNEVAAAIAKAKGNRP
jgi:hypothetical protein